MMVIIADDLTGALDSAAPFAGRGLDTQVVLDLEAIPAAVAEKPDILSISLGSRERTADLARQMTRRVFSLLPPWSVLFKKIDSRLKGNIAAELDETPHTRSLVAPGIPEFGRLVRDGRVEGFGVDTPVSIAGALGRHAGRAIVPDTVSREDMLDIVDGAEASAIDLFIGARGLADALACRMSGIDRPRSARLQARDVLFVIGSRDRITVEQVDVLRKAVPLDYLAAENGTISRGGERRHAVRLVQAVGGDSPCDPADVAGNLVRAVVPALTDEAQTLFLSGGATAESILRAMGISRMQLVGEALPGIGLARAGGRDILTKSGGFGTPETLKAIADRILQKARS